MTGFPKYILSVIVLAQFFCTSLWFAGNGVMADLVMTYNLDSTAVGYLTSSVQFGFIIGTLCFAIFTITDRYSPSTVFFFCAILGAIFNASIALPGNTLYTILMLRFLTGFFLAGIYPVGMKIASDYFDKGLGKSLGFLVGALVLGTALPHLLSDLGQSFPWVAVLLTTSTLALIGGLSIFLFIPDGPYRKVGAGINLRAFFDVFKKPAFRSSAFGYFGHMWELYAFWAFVPTMLTLYNNLHPTTTLNVSRTSFFVIGIGAIACAIGGIFSLKWGTKRTAFYALLLSGCCCLLSPFFFSHEPVSICRFSSLLGNDGYC